MDKRCIEFIKRSLKKQKCELETLVQKKAFIKKSAVFELDDKNNIVVVKTKEK